MLEFTGVITYWYKKPWTAVIITVLSTTRAFTRLATIRRRLLAVSPLIRVNRICTTVIFRDYIPSASPGVESVFSIANSHNTVADPKRHSTTSCQGITVVDPMSCESDIDKARPAS